MMKKKGFTLIELIIVIAILALLIAIAIPKYQQSNLSAQATTHNANVRAIKNAAILYSVDNPEEKSIPMNKLQPYLESKKMPKPAKALGKGEFSVTLQDGQVIVHPGPVKVQDKKLIEDNDQQ
ncbi:prepilin-type N-terminal cleavage/methylation domain-containing protein [Aedoeadaptatus coxii]|uniref:prepilin-type N-terminal cleavage/methylation domain-containing protein n=1 Tax=Aedoeadaptatus coxii TaxID=755172 RepID=UPI002AA2B298|nr:prepilin-type N-terminal cleavage/methylation domain-containing protein [Peptoniphilus coxii]